MQAVTDFENQKRLGVAQPLDYVKLSFYVVSLSALGKGSFVWPQPTCRLPPHRPGAASPPKAAPAATGRSRGAMTALPIAARLARPPRPERTSSPHSIFSALSTLSDLSGSNHQRNPFVLHFP